MNKNSNKLVVELKIGSTVRSRKITIMKESTFDYKPLGRTEAYFLASLAKRIPFVARYLVRRMDRVCVAIVSKYTWYFENPDRKIELNDLFEIASKGVRTAIRLYKPRYDVKFDTYAIWHVREAVHKAIDFHPTVEELADDGPEDGPNLGQRKRN